MIQVKPQSLARHSAPTEILVKMASSAYPIFFNSYIFRSNPPHNRLAHALRRGSSEGHTLAWYNQRMPVPSPAPLELVRALEERALNAWPAHQTVFHRGWVFRLSAGYTKRGNSANALEPDAPFDGVLAAARSVYSRHWIPAVFRISPLAPAAADSELAAAGYVEFDPSVVLHRPLDKGALGAPDAALQLAASPSDLWLEGFAVGTQMPPHHRALHRRTLETIAQPCAYALLLEQGRAAGFGLAVLERDAVGLYDLAVTPSARGQGHGRALVQGLLHWAAQAGATSAYLQVRAQNAAALRLYQDLGFAPAYHYHYRVPPQAF